MGEATPIKDSLESVLKGIPSTGRGFVEARLTTEGFRTEIGHKISPGWKIGGFVGMDWKKKTEGGILLKGNW